MIDSKILLLYKRSPLSIAGSSSEKLRANPRFANNHHTHYKSLTAVEQVLRELGIKYEKRNRSRPAVNLSSYPIIITVGGDGTFLQAARHALKTQVLLGVNSDPNWSVGQFCHTDANNFKDIFQRILSGKYKTRRLYKMSILLLNNGKEIKVECLNDILVCHSNPAGMSRYELSIKGYSEEHRSSGIWFSSAAGSTGAIMSAGGKELPASSREIQYQPRELYYGRGRKYNLTGGIITCPGKIKITSSMARGKIFVDGAHVKFPFGYGDSAVVKSSSNYIRLVYA